MTIPSLLLLASAFVCAAAPAGDPQAETREVLAAFAGALANDNVPDALTNVSKSMPDYEVFARNLRALLQQNDVTSSISPVSNEGDDQKRVLQLDWYLEIRSKSGELGLVRRRENVRCTVERSPKKKWMLTAIEPSRLFEPPQQQRR
jgi:hypothetical protein